MAVPARKTPEDAERPEPALVPFLFPSWASRARPTAANAAGKAGIRYVAARVHGLGGAFL